MAAPTLVESLFIALGLLLDPFNLVLIFIAVIFGMFMGIVPGLGGIVALSLLIPLTFGLDPLIAFMILASVNGGTNFGGSISAILINTPGGAPNAATLLDGYPMARQGRAGEAIGASATASAAGALFGVLVLVVLIPIMFEISLLFGPPEIFWLGIWGISVLVIVVRGNILPGLISGAFGLIFAMHGLNGLSSNVRWNYGFSFMYDGFKLVPALIGLFAVAEMINLMSEGGKITEEEAVQVSGGQWQGVKDVFEHRWLFLRSSILGTIIGTIPGVGGTVANYLAYFQAVQISDNPEKYGTGDVRGVIASEASNDAKDGGALIPTLGLGIPGSAAMAILFGAFILHGIQPGPFLMRDHLDLVAVIIVSLVVSNVLTSLIGLITANQLMKITQIDIELIVPIIIGVSFFGTYAINNNQFDLFITLIFGLLGFLMIKVNISRVPMILGMVLGPIIESEFFRSLQISGGDYSIFISSPLAIILIILLVISLGYPYLKILVYRIRAVQ